MPNLSTREARIIKNAKSPSTRDAEAADWMLRHLGHPRIDEATRSYPHPDSVELPGGIYALMRYVRQQVKTS